MPTPLGAAPRVHRTRFAGPPAARRLPSRFHDPPLFLTVAPIYLLTPPLLREAPFPTAPHHLRSGKRTRPPRDARRTASPLEPTVVKLLVQPWLSVPRAHISDVPTRPTRARAYGCLIEARRRLKKRLSGQLEHAEKDVDQASRRTRALSGRCVAPCIMFMSTSFTVRRKQNNHSAISEYPKSAPWRSRVPAERLAT